MRERIPKCSRHVLLGAGLCVLISAVSAGVAYWATYRYLLKEAEEHIQDLMISNRGIHQYVQRVIDPTYYEAMAKGEVKESFYAPQVFSSSYAIRVTHGFINDEREAAGLPETYYKMAATNPRNPVNRADAQEAALIRLFNEDHSLTSHREVVSVDGKRYLYYAVPFLETTQSCMRCHGRRADAPAGLQALYPGEGGFNESTGQIRAVESIRVPLGSERVLAWVVGGAACTGLLAFGVLVFLSWTLRSQVRLRTAELEKEVREREQAEEALRKSEEHLLQVQKMESVGRLAGGVAHDLNNILAVILGYGELMEDGLPPTSPDRGSLKEIMKAGERARDLTQQLLAFSRKQVLEIKRINAGEMVRSMQSMLARLLGEHIRIRVSIPEKACWVDGDRPQLEQVLLNLCVNARDAMPMGGALTITVAAADLDEHYAEGHPGIKPGPYVQLMVSDTGCGMDEETRNRIFEPFFTTKGRAEGTGLGLATAYGIVKQHGGDIWVYSEPGCGTTFKAFLPRSAGEAEAERSQEKEAALSGSGETVLLIEDETSVREMVVKMLRRLGYVVLEAESAEECCRLIDEAGHVDVLLTDVVMPDLNGKQVYNLLAADRPELKVLFMSGYTEDVIAHHGILDAEVNFIPKPFSERALSLKLFEVLHG